MDVKLSRYACYLIDTIYKDEILWLSQKECCNELDKKSVTEKCSLTADDGKNYNTTISSLDAIIAVGYRINSKNVQGEKEAKDVHYEVGKKVRKAIADIGGTMTEEMPTPKKSLKELEKAKKRLEIKPIQK